MGARPLWPAGRQGGRLHGGALSSISAIGSGGGAGGGGGGAGGETADAGPWEPRSCPAEPGLGGGLESARTGGARGPGSSARRSAAVSGEVREPLVGRGHFPEGLGLG